MRTAAANMQDTMLDSTHAADTAVDTATDTIPAGETLTPVVMQRQPEGIDAPLRADGQTAGSWLLFAVLMVVGVVFARYKSNVRYIKMMFNDLTNTRARGNAFDDTAKETSFMFMLNVLCAITMGLVLFVAVTSFNGIAVTAATFAASAWVCIAAVAAYCLVMPAVYWIVATVFSDTAHARIWVRGFLASQALLGLTMLLPALVALFYPNAARGLSISALALLAVIKLIFISKSYRIFFARVSSWVHFLYYLCTLEILPLVLTYSAALTFAA